MRLLKRGNDGSVCFTEDFTELELHSYEYAILSHTWGKDEEEVTYEDIMNGIGTRKPGQGSEKIRFCVRQTTQDNLDYFWVDTCCINKKSDAELSRSLRSMFRWYTGAKKCYVYLTDVPKGNKLKGGWEQEDFRFSRWFKRGWTLQELIAPPCLEFYSKHGVSLGTKASLEMHINEITRIPAKALRGQVLADFSIHERRQWQEGRQTREPEDMVYSLLGLLEVSMPVLYGEGFHAAQQRLENEINVAQKGVRYKDFSLAFSLSDAPVETQHLVAREAELREMRDNLSTDGSRRVIVLHGLGGIGKTQLTMAYAKRYRDDYSAVFWLNAKDEVSINSSFASTAKQILRGQPSAPHLAGIDGDHKGQEIVGAVKAWLSTPGNTRWLMICDNYDNPNVPGNSDPAALDLRQFFPEPYQGCIIITTRSSKVQLGYCMHIKKLGTLQDSLEVLRHTSGRAHLAQDDEAVQLAKKLDGLPLALATAGAYLSQSTMTFAKYLDAFNKSWAKLHQMTPALMTYEDRTLFSTWQVSFEQIERRNPISANLLRWWAYFDNQDLWFELLDHRFRRDAPWMAELIEDELKFQECMQVLCDHGLVEPNARTEHDIQSTGYSVHSCVHSWMTDVLNVEYSTELARAALLRVASHVPGQDMPNWSFIQRRLLNHANQCASYLERADIDEGLELAYACHCLGDLYDGQKRGAEAVNMYRRALIAKEDALGPNDPRTLSTVSRLGNLYARQGKDKLYADQDMLMEAEKLHTRVLEASEQALGADHPNTLDCVENMANLYAYQGKLEDAERMYERSLEGLTKTVGPDNPSILDTYSNLANLYQSQGKLKEAEEMFKRSLEGKEKNLGPEHYSTLGTVYCLGLLYQAQGRLKKAEDMIVRARNGRKKVLGAEHHLTLRVVGSLGVLYELQGRPAEAEAMYMRALTGREKTLGADHISTIRIVGRLSTLYLSQDRPVEARKMLIRELKGKEKALGPDHEATLAVVTSLGLLFASEGSTTEQAREMYHRATRNYETLPLDLRSVVDDLGDMLSEEAAVKNHHEPEESNVSRSWVARIGHKFRLFRTHKNE